MATKNTSRSATRRSTNSSSSPAGVKKNTARTSAAQGSQSRRTTNVDSRTGHNSSTAKARTKNVPAGHSYAGAKVNKDGTVSSKSSSSTSTTRRAQNLMVTKAKSAIGEGMKEVAANRAKALNRVDATSKAQRSRTRVNAVSSAPSNAKKTTSKTTAKAVAKTVAKAAAGAATGALIEQPRAGSTADKLIKKATTKKKKSK